jgi:hypothetical protein
MDIGNSVKEHVQLEVSFKTSNSVYKLMHYSIWFLTTTIITDAVRISLLSAINNTQNGNRLLNISSNK